MRDFVAMIAATPALREYARRMVERHEEALADTIVATTEPQVSRLAARALARFLLGGLDLARHEPDRHAALAEIVQLLRAGWSAGR